MRHEMSAVADVAAGVQLAVADRAIGASDDTTKMQQSQGTNNVHFIDKGLACAPLTGSSHRNTVNIGIADMAVGTADAKAKHFSSDLARCRRAATEAVPDFHGDPKAYDRVAVSLLTGWCSDRAAVESGCDDAAGRDHRAEARPRTSSRASVAASGCRERKIRCARPRSSWLNATKLGRKFAAP